MGLGYKEDEPQPSAADRLMEAVLWHWEQLGSASTSTRSLCRVANVQMASLYHHFDNLERLYAETQSLASDRAETWCQARLDGLAGVSLPPAAIGPFLADLIDDWCMDQRQLVFARRECGLLAARQERFRPILAQWNHVWERFWSQAMEHFGLGEYAAITGHFFLGQSIIHIMPWRRSFDRATLHEACVGWAAWLCGDPVPPSPWFDLARSQAEGGLVLPELTGDIPQRIASAAAVIVETQGVGCLTHRAVAAEAGISLGVVSHRFRTVADLLAAAFETIYQRMIRHKASLPDIADPNLDALSLRLTEGTLGGPSLGMGNDELLLACARRPSLKPFTAQLRYMRGRSGMRYLQMLAGPNHSPRPIDAFIFSTFMMGLIGTYGTMADRDARITHALPDIRRVSTLFARSLLTCPFKREG